MDDTLSILASLIWVLALGMWPVGFFFAGCSPCCGASPQAPQCPWLLDYEGCLRVTSPSRKDTRSLYPVIGINEVTFPATGLTIRRLASSVQSQIGCNLTAPPVGQTRTATYRLASPLPTNPSSFDLLGPTSLLDVSIEIVGVATAQEQTESVSFSAGVMTISLRRRPGGFFFSHPATVSRTGHQRLRNLGSQSATLVSGTNVGTVAANWTAVARSLAVFLGGDEGISVLDDANVQALLTKTDEVEVGSTSIRIFESNLICDAPALLVSIGVASGVYPEVIYASVQLNSSSICQETVGVVPLLPRAAITASLNCADSWGARDYLYRESFSVPGVSAASLWRGDTLFWNLENGPVESPLVQDIVVDRLPGIIGGEVVIGQATYYLEEPGGQEPADPRYYSPVSTTPCRAGYTATGRLYCYPSEVSVSVSGNVEFLRQSVSICGTVHGSVQIPVSTSVTLRSAANGPTYEGSASYVSGGFRVQVFVGLSQGLVPCATAGLYQLPCSVTVGVQEDMPQPQFRYITPARRQFECSGGPSPPPDLTTTASIQILERFRVVCGPPVAAVVPAAGGSVSYECEQTDGEVVLPSFTQSVAVPANNSRLPKAVAVGEGVVLQEAASAQCLLAGMRDMRFSGPDFEIPNPYNISALNLGECIPLGILFAGNYGSGPVCSGEPSFAIKTWCGSCTPTVSVTSGDDLAHVHVVEGSPRGTLLVEPKRTWLSGHRVTFSVTCGEGTLTQTIRIPDAAPSVVSNLAASRGPCDTATLTWTAPHDGGQPITNYTVQYRPVGAFDWITLVRPASTATTATVTGLLQLAYQFRVAAVNSLGTGQFADLVLGGAPTAPTNVVAVAGNAQATLTWEGGEDPCVINANHTLQFRLTATSPWSTLGDTGSPAKTFTVTGLTNGVQYRFRVRAINSLGGGPYSAESNPVTPSA